MLAFAALLAVVPFVAAQDTASAAASAAAIIPSCALTCTIQNAGSSTCGGIANVTCLCSDDAFQASVFNCYTAECSESELQSAIQYGYGICQTVGITLETTAIPSGATATRATGGNSTASSTASSSATSSGAGSTTPAPTSSAAAQTTSSASGTAAPASASPTGAAERFAVPAVAAIAGVAGLAALFL